jgi:4'-phosphopantetheinyl transferase
VTGLREAARVAGAAPVELWLADLDRLAGPLTALDDDAPLLGAYERAQLGGRRRIARLALRLLLERAFGAAIARAPFQSGGHGKPTLPGLTGDFNLSHAGSHALIGLGTATSVGVDLEPIREVRMNAARRAAIADAAVRVADGAALPPNEDARTLQAWTRLEALAKADGQGIGRTLARLGVWGRPSAAAPLPPANAAPDTVRADLVVHDVAAGSGLHAAVALPRGIVPPALQHLPAGTDALAAIRTGASPAPESGPNSGVDLAPAPRQKGHAGA